MDAHAAFWQKHDRREKAARLCRAIQRVERDDEPNLMASTELEHRIDNCDDVAVFTELCHWGDDEFDLPLDMAATVAPRHALAMLARGADIEPASIGSASLLYSAALEDEGGQAVFAELLRRGADPTKHIIWCTRVDEPYNRSLLANLIELRATPLIVQLLELPHFDGLVWPHPAGPPLAAADYAWRMGDDELGSTLKGWRRWSVPRRAWVSAALRARPPPPTK